MILIGIGANLPGPGQIDARATCEAAFRSLEDRGIEVTVTSPWYESEPVPRSDQPWYVNAVAGLVCGLAPGELLALLHEVEAAFGRVRGAPNAARTLDLDLLDHDGLISEGEGWPILPHPRLHARAFVLLPLRDIAPDWTHPRSGAALDALIAALPADQRIRRMDG
jgi:2-amino-4-hydroxy-6-hydroxymethyldihydropteridine diphosphokinase